MSTVGSTLATSARHMLTCSWDFGDTTAGDQFLSWCRVKYSSPPPKCTIRSVLTGFRSRAPLVFGCRRFLVWLPKEVDALCPWGSASTSPRIAGSLPGPLTILDYLPVVWGWVVHTSADETLLVFYPPCSPLSLRLPSTSSHK
ncbi:hypothetical protein CSUI_009738 [Cystoisospora suis]|uniref:Uncharacterized protein n=1 Tax=Cystoisospora suis TaxID=483139 RepID=A0A2C6KH49_9APIC|nr:hypothetical protein CSUI_009738 [Cystoisospora suis]